MREWEKELEEPNYNYPCKIRTAEITLHSLDLEVLFTLKDALSYQLDRINAYIRRDPIKEPFSEIASEVNTILKDMLTKQEDLADSVYELNKKIKGD